MVGWHGRSQGSSGELCCNGQGGLNLSNPLPLILTGVNIQHLQVKERLDAVRGGRGSGRGPPVGGRGVFSRLGATGFGGEC